MAIKRAGLDRLTLRNLRHTAASLAVASGAHIKVIQKMLGHESAATTLYTYADLFNGDLNDVAERIGELAPPFAARAMKALGVAAWTECGISVGFRREAAVPRKE